MSASVLSSQCYGGHIYFGDRDLGYHEPEHDRCPGSQTTPGVLGGWVCSCECHRASVAHTREETK